MSIAERISPGQHRKSKGQIRDGIAVIASQPKRERTQLTIQATPDLLANVRGIAERRRQTVTAVVVEALEAYIAGDQVLLQDEGDLARRVADLEQRVRKLEALA